MKTVVAAGTVALSVIFAACGGSSDTAGDNDSVAEDPPPDTAAGAEEPEEAAGDSGGCNVDPPADATTVDYYGWTFDIMDFYAAEIEECAEVDNVDVEVQLLDSATVAEGVRLALSAGGESPYDIIHIANSGMIEFGLEGWLMPLNDLIDKYGDEYDLDDIPEAAWEGATIDGNIYGVPVVANTLHLAYRADLFEQYGIEPPTTYDDVIVACETLSEEGSLEAPFAMDLSAGWAWELEFLAFVRAFGGDFVNDDGTPAFNSPEGVEAAEKLKEVSDTCMGAAHLSYGYEANEVAMSTGALGFTQIWAANTPSMVDPESSNFAEVIDFAPAPAPVPGGPLGGTAWNDFFVIPEGTTADPELLFQIIMEATDLESQTEAAELGIVTRQSVEGGIAAADAAVETIVDGVGIYQAHPGTPLARAALANWLPFVGTGEMTAQEALDAAAEEYTNQAEGQGVIG